MGLNNTVDKICEKLGIEKGYEIGNDPLLGPYLESDIFGYNMFVSTDYGHCGSSEHIDESRSKTPLLENKENHGFGFHSHVRVRRNNKKIRSGTLITVDDDFVYAVAHGNSGKVHLSPEELAHSRKGLKVLRRLVKEQYENISVEDMLPPSEEAVILYERDW
ncbi:hypothetical protein GOV09_06585 [Candidatus Woesearchaeota archaeon]|nr:hypothetical protein [Candidatus Woesearchaeota archaeon]